MSAEAFVWLVLLLYAGSYASIAFFHGWRERRRERKRRRRDFRVVAQYEEPYSVVTKTYTARFCGPVNDQRLEQIALDLKAREQAEKRPVILSLTELEQ